jgi:hypothetical protein
VRTWTLHTSPGTPTLRMTQSKQRKCHILFTWSDVWTDTFTQALLGI